LAVVALHGGHKLTRCQKALGCLLKRDHFQTGHLLQRAHGQRENLHHVRSWCCCNQL